MGAAPGDLAANGTNNAAVQRRGALLTSRKFYERQFKELETSMRRLQQLPDLPSAQVDLVERMRRESCLDKRVKLAIATPFKIERGPSAESWYRAKHARGEYGQFHLHQISRTRDE
jgi:hypothetical protein